MREINLNVHASTSGCTTENKCLMGASGISELMLPNQQRNVIVNCRLPSDTEGELSGRKG